MRKYRPWGALVSLITAASISYGVEYTWNGSAGDGDWANTANWLDGSVPTVLAGGAPDIITFDGDNMPTTNLATFGNLSYGDDSAVMIFNSGGSFELDLSTSYDFGFVAAASRTILTIGDGVGGGSDDVEVNITGIEYLLRHANVTANFLVNSDGVLNVDGDLGVYDPKVNKEKNVTLTLDGGSIVATGVVDEDFARTDFPNCHIEFLSLDSSLTADYGGAFTNFTMLQEDVGGVFINSSGGILEKVDHGGSNYTVTAVFSPVLAEIHVSTNSGVAPLEITFDGSASTPTNDIVSYTWDFGDGDVASGDVVTHTYTNLGSFMASLTVVDSSNHTNSTSVAIDVSNPVAPVINVSTNSGVYPLEITFDASASSSTNGVSEYLWEFGDGSVSNGSPVAHTYTVAGDYTASLTVVDALGYSNSTTTAITIGSPIIADMVISEDNAKAPATIYFDGTGSSASSGIASYEWDFGDGTTNYGALATNTFAAGEYTVTLTVTDHIGDSNSTSTNIQVWAMPENVGYSVTTSGSAGATPAISTNDLAQTDLLSIVGSDVTPAWGGSISNIVNGVVQTKTTALSVNPEAVLTITFDTSVNALGYDITQIDTIFGNNPYGGGRANQGYSVTVTYMDDSTELILGKKTWVAEEIWWTKVSFTNAVGGVIASGVKAITFADFDGSLYAGDYVRAHEFDIFGAPTTDITEPPVISIEDGSLVWDTPIVAAYDVQYKVDLVYDTDWMLYTNIISTPPTTSVELPMGRDSEEFFRVIVSEE